MSDAILVAYATRYGSTEEVAHAVGERLRERGVPVDVKPVREVTSLDGYGGVVLAAPLYIGSLLKDARAFLERHKPSLERLPFALLALGPTSRNDDMTEARGQLDDVIAKMPGIRPVAAELFVGKYDPAALRGFDKMLAALPASPLHGRPAADDRDWDAIGSWAERLPETLHVAV